MVALPNEHHDEGALADDELATAKPIDAAPPGDDADGPAPAQAGDLLINEDDLAPLPVDNALDLEIEALLSSEGIPARQVSHGAVRAPFDDEPSLDELLDTFDDEALAVEAFADAESYAAAPPVLTPLEENAPQEPVGPPAPKPAAARPAATSQAPSQPAAAPAVSIAPGAPEPTPTPETPLKRARRLARERAAAQAAAEPAAAPSSTPAAANPPVEQRRGGFWRGLGLVLLGGLLGVALTLLGLMVWSGTLSFASRAHVEALSRNMGTMQGNQELAWQRLDTLAPQLASQEARLAQSEQELAALRAESAAAQARVETLSQELAAMQQQLTTSLTQSEQRMATLEGQSAQLDQGLTQLTETVTPLQAAVQRFDDFLSSMRDLLNELQGAP